MWLMMSSTSCWSFPRRYQEEGHSVDTIQAVLARRPTRPADFDARMKAVSHFRTLEAASALAAANKRVSNIGESHRNPERQRAGVPAERER